jgi:hypothetical protein
MRQRYEANSVFGEIMTDTTSTPPTPVARTYVRYVVGFSVGVGAGISPFLGRVHVPGFSALLSLFPAILQNTLIPIASFFMGVVAVAVQFLARDRASLQTLRRTFGVTLALLIVFGLALVVGYALWVTQVPIRGGEARVSFVTGDVRLPTCRCGTLSDQECIEQLSLNDAAVSACWGDKQVKRYTLALELLYFSLTCGFGCLIGVLFLRESWDGKRRPPQSG